MSEHTTTLFDIIQSELILRGHDEFTNDGKWTFFDDRFSFIKKIMKYDDDVKEIVNEVIFHGEKLEDEMIDDEFKKTFIKKFLENSINRQTVEAFSLQVVYTLYANKDYIMNVYKVNDFLLNKRENDNTGENNSTNTTVSDSMTDNRNLHSDLPQTEVNLNVDDTELDYGTTNTISRNKDRGNTETVSKQNDNNKSNSIEYNIDSLIKIKGLLEIVFIDFNKNCFMQSF